MAQVQEYRVPLLAAERNGHSHDFLYMHNGRPQRQLSNGKCSRSKSADVVLDIAFGEESDSSSDDARSEKGDTSDHIQQEQMEKGDTSNHIQQERMDEGDDNEIGISGSADNSCQQQSEYGSHPLYGFLGDQPVLGDLPAVDPFRNHTEDISNLYEWIKVVLCLPLAIIRMMVILLTTLFGLCLAKLLLLGWKDKQLPMPRWRRHLLYTTRLLGRFILFCFGYHWIRRLGRPAKREVAPIIVSNHVSFIDPIFFFYEFFPSFVSSASHSKLPGIGTIIRCMQVISVDRSSAESKKHALKEIKDKAMSSSYPRVMLFPEGTTTNGKVLIFFQLGAFMPGLPVQPVVLRYPFVHFDNSWGKISVLKLIFRMLTQFHNFMEVEYLPAVFPSPKEKMHPALFAKKVKAKMAKALNVAETNHSYGDLMLSTRASELDLCPASLYMVEMATMEKVFGVSTKEAMDFLANFGAMDSCNSGYVTEDQYLGSLDLPKTSFSQQIFGFFDKEEGGSITFREFLAGSAFILKHPSFGRLSRVAFEIWDVHKQDFLTSLEVECPLRTMFPEMTNLQVEKMVKKLDIDGDGIIGWDDFRIFLQKHPELLVVFLPPGFCDTMFTNPQL